MTNLTELESKFWQMDRNMRVNSCTGRNQALAFLNGKMALIIMEIGRAIKWTEMASMCLKMAASTLAVFKTINIMEKVCWSMRMAGGMMGNLEWIRNMAGASRPGEMGGFMKVGGLKVSSTLILCSQIKMVINSRSIGKMVRRLIVDLRTNITNNHQMCRKISQKFRKYTSIHQILIV
jgi:hypothetical protein